MRSVSCLAAVLALVASPALALSVTNLDTVPHRVRLVAAGTSYERAVAPNETTRFEGLPNGTLSLLTSPQPNEGGALQADGLLRHIIGNGRDQHIPVDGMDDYTIWPGGDLQLQRRMKRYGRY